MDKRTLIAVVLAIVVLIGYQYLSALFQPQQLTPPPPAKDTVAGSVKKEPPPAATVPPVVEEPSQARNVTVETGLYSATLSSKGGTVRKFTLKTYKDKTGTGVSLLQAPGMYPPLALGEKEDFGLSNVNFSLKGADLNLKGSESGTVTFEYATPQFSVRRTFTFYGDRYKIDLKDDVQGLPEYWVTLGSNFGIYDAKDESAPHIGPVVLKDADRIELVTKKLDEPKVYKEGLKWIAQEDKYFFASIVPSGQVLEAKVWKVQDSPVVALKVKPGVSTYIVYAGPKDYDRLQELKVGLEHIVDFGFFSILARPLFWILKFFYRFMGNYGWAIVLLTIIVRIPFIPLLNKSQKSMKKMQEIQPKLTELREKYKKDPQKLQKETMEMYKKYKVNPMGGCLPMLLQIPVFFALYKVLMIAIELRGAPFMLWITDLSAKDPYYVMPIVMGVTMVIQQKMTPTSLDPKQNKIMMLMPVVFTFLFLNFASGLVLYWLVNNVLSIIQQFFTNRKLARESA
ncbi:MAG: membrane protein insertase YidC [Nitrospirae bacterium]|nr:membrane protein insertase YidC [Nitrospirota bacterium]